MRAPGACVLALLACSSALGVAAAAAQSMLPRLFPRPAELVLGPPEQTTDLHPCRFGIERAGAWAAALLDTDMWAVPPETAFDLYRPLILRGAGCDRLGSGGSGAFVQLSVALNASIPAAANDMAVRSTDDFKRCASTAEKISTIDPPSEWPVTMKFSIPADPLA